MLSQYTSQEPLYWPGAMLYVTCVINKL